MPSSRPNPNLPYSRYRKSSGARVVLPSECSLPAPRLPAGRRWSTAEKRQWKELWASPQASQWDDSFGQAVAMFIVHSGAVLEGRAAAWMAQEARHLADKLGLTPSGMAALGWQLAEPGQEAEVLPLRSVL